GLGICHREIEPAVPVEVGRDNAAPATGRGDVIAIEPGRLRQEPGLTQAEQQEGQDQETGTTARAERQHFAGHALRVAMRVPWPRTGPSAPMTPMSGVSAKGA